MKKNILRAGWFGLLGMGLSSCEIVGDIFQAGMYWGIFMVVALIALIIYIVRKAKR